MLGVLSTLNCFTPEFTLRARSYFLYGLPLSIQNLGTCLWECLEMVLLIILHNESFLHNILTIKGFVKVHKTSVSVTASQFMIKSENIMWSWHVLCGLKQRSEKPHVPLLGTVGVYSGWRCKALIQHFVSWSLCSCLGCVCHSCLIYRY